MALFLAGAPGVEEGVRRLVSTTAVVSGLNQQQQCAVVKGKTVEVTETMRIERLREMISRAAGGKGKAGKEGGRRGMRMRIQLLV